MGYRTVTVDVDVYVDDVINECEDQDLVDELESRGYYVFKGESFEEALDKYDWKKLEEIVGGLPYHWETEELRRKIITARMR